MEKNGFHLNEPIDRDGRIANSRLCFKVAASGFALASALYISKQYTPAAVIGGISFITLIQGLEFRFGGKIT